MANPILVNATRGGIIESAHRGAYAIATTDGVVARLGDIDTPIFPRSSIKIFQAVPLVTSGAADAFALADEHLALACASHDGEPTHVTAATAMLHASGAELDALACGAHAPSGRRAADALVAAGEQPSALHNNCSGKHAGMIAVARHRGFAVSDYEHKDHPVQQDVREVLARVAGTPLDTAPCGIDGCSLPTYAMPLAAMSRAMVHVARARDGAASARDASAPNLPAEISGALARLRTACVAHPEMTSGAHRHCARVMRASGGEAYVKVGAEGVYCGAVFSHDRAIGIALKIDDGAFRAAEVAVATIIAHLLPERALALATLSRPLLKNWRGTAVGDLAPSEPFSSALADAASALSIT